VYGREWFGRMEFIPLREARPQLVHLQSVRPILHWV